MAVCPLGNRGCSRYTAVDQEHTRDSKGLPNHQPDLLPLLGGNPTAWSLLRIRAIVRRRGLSQDRPGTPGPRRQCLGASMCALGAERLGTCWNREHTDPPVLLPAKPSTHLRVKRAARSGPDQKRGRSGFATHGPAQGDLPPMAGLHQTGSCHARVNACAPWENAESLGKAPPLVVHPDG